jgi:hypothetical protein
MSLNATLTYRSHDHGCLPCDNKLASFFNTLKYLYIKQKSLLSNLFLQYMMHCVPNFVLERGLTAIFIMILTGLVVIKKSHFFTLTTFSLLGVDFIKLGAQHKSGRKCNKLGIRQKCMVLN